MTTPAPIENVVIDRDAAPAELAAVEEAFTRAGFDVRVTAGYEARAADIVPWIIAVTLLTPIVSFFQAFGSAAGQDAYAVVKRWVHDLWQARAKARAAHGSIVVEDPDGSTIVLSTRIPERAIDALIEIDWTAKRGHYLVWDDERDEWRDPTRRDHEAT